MVQRQPFGDFLNSGSPSTPRGRGRGGSRGGGGRGGGRGGYTPGSGKKSFNADYSNMGFDYEKVNGQRYTKMDGFNVQPFGPPPADSGGFTPRGRGGYTPGGRGRGFQQNRGPHQNPSTPSGAATPVRGLGFRDQVPTTRAKGDHRGLGVGHSTVGKGIGTGTVTWGGGKAPLFVKAGELFKEGEVDIITMGEDHKLHVQVLPLSDPSAPQMTHLQDDTEIDIMEQPSPVTSPASSSSSSDIEEPSFTVEGEQDSIPSSLQEDALEELLGFGAESNATDANVAEMNMSTSDSAPVDHVEMTQQPITNSGPDEMADVNDIPMSAGQDVLKEEDQIHVNVDETPLQQDEVLFYVDIDPDVTEDIPVPTYDTIRSTPLGEISSNNASMIPVEEEILFVPKTYRKPEPVFIDIGPASQSTRQAIVSEPPSRVFVNPRALSRAEKKAAKRDKRRGRGKKTRQKKADRVPRDDSDIEWGSDGPPVAILDVDGIDSDEGEDMKILRDYLKGTMLNAESAGEEENVEAKEASETESTADDDVAEEMDVEAMRLFGQGIKGLTENGQEILDENEWQSEESQEDEVSQEEANEEDDDDDEDDSSSVLGEIDIEGMLDDISDEEQVDAFFKGSSQWTNETDWFVTAMEDALDGTEVNMRDRKSRNSLFKSIENGDFGDDWGLAPVKKGKKNKFVPPALQAQWEKDRLVKAEKKQQRELERLIAEIEPTLSGYSRKGKAKAKGKGKAHQAAVAHLIPASASQVADMFDITSDEEDEDELRLPLFKKGGRIPTSLPLEIIDQKINFFLEDGGKTTLSLPPMGKEDRKKVHMLADCYSLGSKSRGSGKTRFTVLTKNKRSGTLVDVRKLERLLSASQKVGGGFYNALRTRGSKPKAKGPSGGPSVKHKDGDMVGHGADRIGQDNIGHQLLSRMGWAEGDRIGRGAGLEAPIVAIVKNTKTGLGA
ncbi:uncharacterized protein IL334_001103 [Kwoniella shivajii]|uniref:Protein SQS1 n=1 Tax=Kwoniella shivajii TaxID=564305 RepID=A0ABZ1CSL7_9TREE|nr:hypothetical protein IL334_001103 [Kwoniella shivajii]